MCSLKSTHSQFCTKNKNAVCARYSLLLHSQVFFGKKIQPLLWLYHCRFVHLLSLCLLIVLILNNYLQQLRNLTLAPCFHVQSTVSCSIKMIHTSMRFPMFEASAMYDQMNTRFFYKQRYFSTQHPHAKTFFSCLGLQ